MLTELHICKLLYEQTPISAFSLSHSQEIDPVKRKQQRAGTSNDVHLKYTVTGIYVFIIFDEEHMKEHILARVEAQRYFPQFNCKKA